MEWIFCVCMFKLIIFPEMLDILHKTYIYFSLEQTL